MDVDWFPFMDWIGLDGYTKRHRLNSKPRGTDNFSMSSVGNYSLHHADWREESTYAFTNNCVFNNLHASYVFYFNHLQGWHNVFFVGGAGLHERAKKKRRKRPKVTPSKNHKLLGFRSLFFERAKIMNKTKMKSIFNLILAISCRCCYSPCTTCGTVMDFFHVVGLLP